MAPTRISGCRRVVRVALLLASDDPGCVPPEHNHRGPSVLRGSPAGRLVARTACIIALAAPLVVGCSAASDPATTTAPTASDSPPVASSSAAAETPKPTQSPCPNPEGQACLGRLAAGTYTTQIFHPTLTYTVPAGWKNYEDTPGNFLLVPPHGNLPGVNAGTSDFIGIYTSVAPPKGCEIGVEPGVLATVAGYRGWAKRQPGFRNPRFRPVKVGGLSGIVADLRLARGWTKTCIYSDGLPVQPLITGLGISFLDHNVLPGQVTRLYLLDYLQGALAIEVVDIKDAHHLPDYSQLVQKLRFGT
jgi:hypothetical protein